MEILKVQALRDLTFECTNAKVNQMRLDPFKKWSNFQPIKLKVFVNV
jgi:hypothetical protein